MEYAASAGPIFARRGRRSHLPDGRGREQAFHVQPGAIHGPHPVAARSAQRAPGKTAQIERPGVAQSGQRRQERLRLLLRFRPGLVRPGRQRAVARPARPVQQPVRPRRIAGTCRRHAGAGLRRRDRLVHHRLRHGHGQSEMAQGKARRHPRLLDAGDLPARWQTGRGAGSRLVQAHGLRGRDRRSGLVRGRPHLAVEADAGARQGHHLRARLGGRRGPRSTGESATIRRHAQAPGQEPRRQAVERGARRSKVGKGLGRDRPRQQRLSSRSAIGRLTAPSAPPRTGSARTGWAARAT